MTVLYFIKAVVIVMLLSDFRSYGIVFMNVCAIRKFL